MNGVLQKYRGTDRCMVACNGTFERSIVFMVRIASNSAACGPTSGWHDHKSEAGSASSAPPAPIRSWPWPRSHALRSSTSLRSLAATARGSSGGWPHGWHATV